MQTTWKYQNKAAPDPKNSVNFYNVCRTVMKTIEKTYIHDQNFRPHLTASFYLGLA